MIVNIIGKNDIFIWTASILLVAYNRIHFSWLKQKMTFLKGLSLFGESPGEPETTCRGSSAGPMGALPLDCLLQDPTASSPTPVLLSKEWVHRCSTGTFTLASPELWRLLWHTDTLPSILISWKLPLFIGFFSGLKSQASGSA